MEDWYVLQTLPHKERPVADYLRAHGLKVYTPLVKVQPVNPRAAHERPLFPTYLFVRGDLSSFSVQRLERTPGVRCLVQFGEQPAVLPDKFIALLARHLDRIRRAGGLALDGPRPSAPAETARGPFAGYEALFDMRLSESDRMLLLFEFIHTSQGQRTRPTPAERNAGKS